MRLEAVYKFWQIISKFTQFITNQQLMFYIYTEQKWKETEVKQLRLCASKVHC